MIPRIVREVIADRIEGKVARRRGRPKKAMSLTHVFARIAFRHLRRQIQAARRGSGSASDSAKTLAQEWGTPKDLVLEEVAGRFDMESETLRYWYYSAPERGRKLQKADRSTEPPSPPVAWEAVRLLIQTHTERTGRA